MGSIAAWDAFMAIFGYKRTTPLTDSERYKAAAAYLQQCRKDAGYTQQEMADLIGTTVGTYQYNEAGTRAVIPSVAYGAAEHTSLDVDKLYALLGRMPPDLIDTISGRERLIKKVREIVERWGG